MKNNKLDRIKDRVTPEQLAWLYATERVTSSLDKFTDAISTAFTNPFSIGSYLKLLPGKKNPLSFLFPYNFLAVVFYLIATRYGTEVQGYLTIVFTFIFDAALLIAEYGNRNSKKNREG